MQFKLNKKNELFIVDELGNTVMDNVDVSMQYPGKFYNTLVAKRTGEWKIKQNGDVTEISSDNVLIEAKEELNGMVIRTHFTNKTGTPIEHMLNMTVLRGTWYNRIDKTVTNGFVDVNGNHSNDMRSPVIKTVLVENQQIESADFMGGIDYLNQSFIFGYTTFCKYFASIQINNDGTLEAIANMESHPLEVGETIISDWLYIGFCDDLISGIPDYVEMSAKMMDVKLRDIELPAGHCSWYYYMTNITEKTIKQDMETLAANREKLPIKYIQVDDGWETNWGDWEPNEKFSIGMKKLADDIIAEGYLPGIWVAPFGVEKTSDAFMNHKDWFVKNWADDNLCFEYSMDMTNPEVKEYIRKLFHKLSYEWGYRYIKIDIVLDRVAPGRHYDPKATALMNIREGFKLMRESITEDTVILACTCPMAPLAGLCDTMRTSGDVFENWHATKCLFVSALNRYFYHKRYYLNDSDCLVIRNKDNEDSECYRMFVRTDAETQSYVTAIAASGGTIMFTDKMKNLRPEQIDMLSKLFPQNKDVAIPLDFLDTMIPGILDFGYRGNTRVVGFINWENRAKDMEVSIKESYVYEFWSGEYLGIYDRSVSVNVAPHSAKVLFITEMAPAAIVGVNDSICPEINQTYKNGILSANFGKKGEIAYAVAETGDKLEAVSGCKLNFVNGLYEITALDDSMDYSVKIIK